MVSALSAQPGKSSLVHQPEAPEAASCFQTPKSSEVSAQTSVTVKFSILFKRQIDF